MGETGVRYGSSQRCAHQSGESRPTESIFRNGAAHLGGPGARPDPVAAAGEQPLDGNILVQFLPMQTARADRDLVALGGRRMQQPGKPRQRNAAPETVGQIEGHAVLVEPDRLSFHQRTHPRSEEQTSELQSLMSTSYAVFC